MWGKQNIPHPCTPPPPRLSEEVAPGCCAPDFSDLQGTSRSGCLIPLQAKSKIKKKPQTTLLLWFLYQSPSTCCRRQREAARCGEETQRKQAAVREAEKPGGREAALGTHGIRAGPAREARNRYLMLADSLSLQARAGLGLHCRMLGLSEGGPGIAGRFLNT